LNEGLELPVRHDIASLGGNNAGGYSTDLPEGAADGENPIADFHAVRVAHLRRRDRPRQIDLDDRQIGLLINADYFGIVLNAWWIVLQANAKCDPLCPLRGDW